MKDNDANNQNQNQQPQQSVEGTNPIGSINPTASTTATQVTSQTPPPTGESFAASFPSQSNPFPSQQKTVQATTVKQNQALKPNKKFKIPKILIFLFLTLLFVLIAGLIYTFFFKGKIGSSGVKGEIVWWGLWEDESVVTPLIQEYESKNPGVKVTYIQQSPADYRERLINSINKGEGPDVFRFHNSWTLMLKNQLDMMPNSVMGYEEYKSTYYPVIVSDLSIANQAYGIPLGYDALTLYINKDMLEASGQSYPETWDDFRQLAQQLTIRNTSSSLVVSGAALGKTENVDHWQEIVALMMIQNNVNLRKPQDETRLTSDAALFFKRFAAADGMWNPRLPSSTIGFANGTVAMYFGPSWRAFDIKQINPDLNFITIPLPQLPKNEPDEPSYSYATYWAEGVSKTSVNKQLAWDFLKFLSSRESLQKLFENASKTRMFGEAYPRVDMADMLINHEILGSIIMLAPEAKSWYLASFTYDGESGVNTTLSKYFETALNKDPGGISEGNIQILQNGINKTITSFQNQQQ